MPRVLTMRPPVTLAVAPLKVKPLSWTSMIRPLPDMVPAIVVGEAEWMRLSAMELAFGWKKETVSPLLILKWFQSMTTRLVLWLTHNEAPQKPGELRRAVAEPAV